MPALTAKETLIEARKLISDPANWTKGTYRRRTPEGEICAYCAVGAIEEASGYRPDNDTLFSEDAWERRGRAIECLKTAVPKHDVIRFNDLKKTKHADVLAAFDKAIETCDA